MNIRNVASRKSSGVPLSMSPMLGRCASLVHSVVLVGFSRLMIGNAVDR